MVVDLEVLQMGLFPGEVQVSHGAPKEMGEGGSDSKRARPE